MAQSWINPPPPLEHLIDADAAVARGFATATAEKLVSGAMTLADRDRLISRGVRLGLKRFDANLIIATVEQRYRERPGLRLDGPVKNDFAQQQAHAPTTQLPRWASWITVLSVQSAICAGIVWLIT